jgi:hypothetical protein
MAATLHATDTVSIEAVTNAVRLLLEQRRADHQDAMQKLQARGIEPVVAVHHPPTDEELRCDYWWYHGAVLALEYLCESLGLDRLAAPDGAADE